MPGKFSTVQCLETQALADLWERTLARLREIGAARLVEETGFSRSAVYAVLGGVRPHAGIRSMYERISRTRPRT